MEDESDAKVRGAAKMLIAALEEMHVLDFTTSELARAFAVVILAVDEKNPESGFAETVIDITVGSRIAIQKRKSGDERSED